MEIPENVKGDLPSLEEETQKSHNVKNTLR